MTLPPSVLRSADAEVIRSLARWQFGAVAAAYAASPSHAGGTSLARMLELAPPDANDQVLDVAAGAGHAALAYAPHVAAVIASDITPEMLEQVRRLAAARGLTNLLGRSPWRRRCLKKSGTRTS